MSFKKTGKGTTIGVMERPVQPQTVQAETRPVDTEKNKLDEKNKK